MKTKDVEVSYRDKEKHEDIPLGSITVQIPETVAEALELYGEEDLLGHASRAYVIGEQHKFREEHRPDRTKTQSSVSKFKQLSPEKQEELLRAHGVM